MTQAFVLGNGISRQNIVLSQLQSHGKIYGCNALYKEFAPDVLVATDTPIAMQIQQSGYAKTHCFYTRKPIENLGGLLLPKKYFGYSSGPNAVALAAQDNNYTIYLLGFDMGPTENNTFNNVYAGTEFYKPHNSAPTHAKNWIKQLKTIATDYPLTKFIRVHGPTTAEIPEFSTVPNLLKEQLGTFVDRINNRKDL